MPVFAPFPDTQTGLGSPDGVSITLVAKTIRMKPGARAARAKKMPDSAAAKPEPTKIPFFLNHGRAWINGDEVGGSDPRYAHLNRSYD
jgi:hypothetical protein